MKRLFLLLVAGLFILPVIAESRTEKILREIRDPKSKYVVVIAHRGDWRNFPENSLEGYASAIEMGVDVVEIDVRRTKDGHLVICHDPKIDRTTNGKGKVAELTLDSIRKCCLRTGHNIKMPKYKMPTLEEVLDLCKGKVMINIDKGYDYYDQILPMLQKRNMIDEVIIKGTKRPDVVAQKFSKYSHNMLYMPIINYTEKAWDKKDHQLFEDYMKSDLPLIAYELCWNGTLKGEKKIFNQVLKAGGKTWVNTLWDSLCGGEKHGFEDDRAIKNEEAIYGKVLDMGFSFIQTDRPAMLIKYLESKGRHTLK